MGTRLADERWRSASLISTGPVAQLRPTTSTCMASSTVRAAPISVPGSMRPVSSMVTWACSGTKRPRAAMARRAPLMAALTESMSNCVSIEEQVDAALEQARAPAPRRRRGTRRRGSARASGTWCPAPSSPATQRGRSAVANSSRTPQASSAAARLSSRARVGQAVLGQDDRGRAEGVGLDHVARRPRRTSGAPGPPGRAGSRPASRCSPRDRARRSPRARARAAGGWSPWPRRRRRRARAAPAR